MAEGRGIESPFWTWHDSTAFALCAPSLPRKRKKFNEDLCGRFSYVSCFAGQLLPLLLLVLLVLLLLLFSSITVGEVFGVWAGGSGSASFEFDFMAFTRALRNLCNSLPRTPQAN